MPDTKIYMIEYTATVQGYDTAFVKASSPEEARNMWVSYLEQNNAKDVQILTVSEGEGESLDSQEEFDFAHRTIN